jgi:alpha-glucosidase
MDPDAWWRWGVVYQIYPRSFADASGDGIGDLPGIIDHLDHLAGTPDSLGVDAIWLSPIYPSPGLDGGYDVSDHAAIDPVFGTDADFDRLLAEAHRRGLKVILDLVLNHTSDQHPWFIDSRRSSASEHANWYIWRDPVGRDRRGRPRPPNNWLSWFGGSAWAWDETRRQFYLHTFLAQQPDLNWREPAVQEAQFAMVRAWLDRGADGFRMDVFNALLKSEALRSNPRRLRLARRAWDRQRHLHDKDQPELDTLLGQIRMMLDARPGRMSVGELFTGTLELGASLTGPRHLDFDFGLIERPWSARAFAREIDAREAAFGPDRWPAVVLSNHDQPRHVSRYLRALGRSDRGTADRLARAAAVIELTLRGTAFLYYGEEIGLPDVPVPREEIVDPPARRASWLFPWWNRDQGRSPMPWTAAPNGGFSSGRPWIRMIPNATDRNVDRQRADGASVLATYRHLLAIRHASAALSGGSMRRIEMATEDVLVYVREAAGERVLVAVNFTTRHRRLTLPPGSWRTMFSTHRPSDASTATGASVELAGLEACLFAEGPPG